MAKQSQPSDQNTTTSRRWLESEELKAVVRGGMILMNLAERGQFIRALETEMNRSGSTMRAYLIPLGISGTSPDELTPNEVGHLIRFLNIIAPELMPAVERVLSRYSAFSHEMSRLLSRQAA